MEWTLFGTGCLAVSAYVDCLTLEDILDPDNGNGYESSDVLLWFAQIGGCALAWLEKQEIIHRNIRPSVVLVQDYTGTAYLAGFSECFKGAEVPNPLKSVEDSWLLDNSEYRAPEVLKAASYSFPADMFSLATVLCEADDHPGIPTDDVFWRDLMREARQPNPESRLTPSVLISRVERAIGSLEMKWPPFQTCFHSRHFMIHCYRDNGQEFVHRESLCMIHEALIQAGHDVATGTDMDWVYRRRRRAMKLRSAAKFCHKIKLIELAVVLMEALDASNRLTESFEIPFEVQFGIDYHAPSLMIDITRISSIAEIGYQGALSVKNILKSNGVQTLTVFGSWRGEYVPLHSYRQAVAKIEDTRSLRISRDSFHQSNNPQLQRRILSIDVSKYSILVVNQLHPHMVLVRKRDWAIHHAQLLGKPDAWEYWDDSNRFVSLTEAKQFCASPTMQDSLSELEQISILASNEPKLSSDIGDLSESVTSIVTSAEFRKKEDAQRNENSRFVYRKRLKHAESSSSLRNRLAEWSSGLLETANGERATVIGQSLRPSDP